MKNVLKTALVLIVIVAVFCGAMFALNLHTGPIIEAKTTGAAKARLNVVMPDGAGYRDITADLGELPESVVKVHEEINGLGYVVEATASSKYTGNAPMDILIAIGMDGKICGIKLVSHTESLIFGEDYPDTYLGKDSALSGVELFAGSTFSSTAFKTAVEEAMGVLIANDLIKAGVKTPEQILTELLPTVAPDLAGAQKSAGKGDVITAFKAGSAFAYIVVDGADTYLVVVANGASKVYDVSGADVTASKANVVKKAEDYAASAANERLNEVLPGAAGFEDITSTLTNLPASVLKVHKEVGGLGFAIEVAATGYNTAAPMDVVIGVDAQGKIVEVKIFAYNDTPSFDITKKDPAYLDSYKGQDSTLADVGLVAGSTISSTGLKTAVSEAMGALAENNLVQAGVKSDEQILTEMIPTVTSGWVKITDAKASGNIVKAQKASNGTGFAYIMKSGEASYLAVVNAMGVCKVYDVEGNDVTADQAALADEAKAQAATEQTSFASDFETKLGKMMTGAAEFTAIEADTFNTVVSAVSFTVDGTMYYGFYSRAYGFDQMDVYFVLDENGAIVKMDAAEFIFLESDFVEYGGFQGMPSGYVDGFVGATGDAWTGDPAIIAGATKTTDAVKAATADVFAAFNSITGGGK